MKKKDVLLIIGTFLFSFLFYKQGAGLNVFIFSLIMPVCLAVYKPESLKNRLWLLGAFITLLTGFSVFMNATWLSLIAFYASISYLAGVTASFNATPFTAILYSTFSYTTSVGFMFSDMLERRDQNADKEKHKIKWNAVFAMILFIFIVTAVFFFMYQRANPLFKEITKFINLDFLSLQWVMFTFMGFLLVYGFMYIRKLKQWDNYENDAPRYINKERIESKENRFLWFNLEENIERKAGIIMFLLLNIMILTINILDISFLWSGMKLPEGFTFAGYLHQGIYTLIFSCVLAILLILFVFRGKLNFTTGTSTLKILAYTWIIQNVIIAISCAIRNYVYIQHYALTYKRITIFVLLLLLLIGLATTIIKVQKLKNIYFLYRLNCFALMLVFVFVSLFNWDGIITRYNLSRSNPDISYLVDLNNAGLPLLLQYAEQSPPGEKYVNSPLMNFDFGRMDSQLLQDKIYTKTYELLKEQKNSSWKSYNLSDAMTLQKIRQMYENETLKNFIINDIENFDFSLLADFTGLRSLSIQNLSGPVPFNPVVLGPFTKLSSLELSTLQLSTVDSIPELPLTRLDIHFNLVSDASSLVRFTNLNSLDISNNPIVSVDFLERLPKIETLNISNTMVEDLSVLSSLPYLKSLQIRNMTAADFSTLPVCPQLEEIDLSYNALLGQFQNIPMLISGAPNLKKVVLKSVAIGSLKYFTEPFIEINNIKVPGAQDIDLNVLAHLEYLDITDNTLTNLSGIKAFQGLQILIVRNNQLTDIRQIGHVKQLEQLDAMYNPIKSLSGIEYLSSLKQAHFSGYMFTTIEPIASVLSLEALTLAEGTIDDVTPLGKLTNLKYLDLSNSTISSLEFLPHLQNLEFLDLSYYTGTDFDFLLQCPSLKVVVLPRIEMKFKNKLEQEIPMIKIIRDYEYYERDFYLAKYGKAL